MSSQFKPLLAATYKLETTLRFPYLASPKLDGIRCIILDGVPVSRSLKPIPNKYIQQLLSLPELNGLDGELIIGSPTDAACFRNTTTVVMAHDKLADDVVFWVFDDTTNPDLPFAQRLANAQTRIEQLGLPFVKFVEHSIVNDQQEFDSAEAGYVNTGFEGMMIRSITGRYKFGRSTNNENILMKVKRFSDSEAVVIDMLEQETNLNEKTIDALGNAKRSSHQENKKGAGTLGTLLVKDAISGIEFGIGTGLTLIERQHIWDNKEAYIGKLLKYKYFAVGVKEKPRFPVFLGFRSSEDM